MFLVVIVEDWQRQLEVPDDVVKHGHEFFDMVDKDIDKGWKMGPDYIEHPDRDQRIQIVADRLLTAIETEKNELRDLLAGYIITKDSTVTAIRIDPNGDPLSTEIMRH
ncbi:hypothetical protein MNBD_GAMMA12-577 [hydrothermal vent metagenome]|uniref:Uncharacterized protein n=1 Tax=hydrothermal vent metagenome TaxID=652676 RepID=A0A3B0Z8P3_9ZZZZ